MTKKILVIAAHPDDEILGCGGTMAKHVKEGHEVSVLIMAEGITSREEKRDSKKNSLKLAALKKEAEEANSILGVSSIKLLNFPDNRMDSVDLLDIVKKVEEQINQVQPEIVYTHWSGDLNVDHRLTHQAVVTACRPFPGQVVKILLFFEVASSTEYQPAGITSSFNPNWFVDISSVSDLKQRALAIYRSEMCDWPHSRSLTALDHMVCWRGANIGVEAAEAFQLGRKIT